ncbi:MAG: hypothetical protein U1F28_00015 [Acinetobacter sp.]
MDYPDGVLGGGFSIGLYLARYTSWGVTGVWLGLIIGLTIACPVNWSFIF